LDPQLTKLFSEALFHQKQGNRSSALLAYRRIQRHFPDFADGWTNGSVVLFELGRFDEALTMAQTAVALAPENPSAHCALASAEQGLGLVQDAIAHFRHAIRLDPAHFPALTNLAGIHARRGEFLQAVELENTAVAANPSHSALWGNRGHTKLRMLDLQGAEADLGRALELDAANHQVRWNLAYVQLLQGRFREAWPNFRSRLELDDWTGNRQTFGRPSWRGESLDGRTLLVYTEQGFGDTLQFARFLPRLKEFDGRVLLQIYPPLKRLLAHVHGVDALLAEGEPLPDFDLVVPQMELPVILDASPTDILPLPPPTLPERAPPQEMAREGFKVGLVWAGNPTHTNDALRSIDPIALGELSDLQGVAWYGLQKPPAAEPPPLPSFMDLSAYMGDFMDTAHIANQLDLVVTVDTSMAHLAGFLGLSAIVLLAHLPDWRWGLEEKSPWYPSLTLLRQPAHGDWRSVMGALKEEIGRRMVKSEVRAWKTI
jgi:tetratricopeptide (TPR) repeat protein